MRERLKPEDILRLATEKKCIMIPCIGAKRMPAAFMLSMQFRLVMSYIENGCYKYEPKKKE